MANQIIVTQNGNVQVSIEPTPNVQVQISRAAIGTISNVPTANFANYAANVTASNQPNITSLGTLTSLTSGGNITAPFFIGNVIGNVIGNISGNFTVPGTNTAVLFNQQGNAGASDALKFNYSSNILTANGNIVANYYIGNGSQLTDITATTANFANFAGNANVANTANSVAVANVSGIGNIATVNLDGSTSNVLYGNGVWAPSGNPFDQNLNTTDSVTFSALRINGTTRLNDIVADDNTHKIVLSSNYTGEGSGPGGVIQIGSNNSDIGNEITINAANVKIQNLLYPNNDGTNGQVLGTDGATNLAWVTVNNVDNANYANFAGEAYSVAGSNVTGQVGNALVASTVYTNAQPNITSVGNLTSVTVSGDALVAGNLTVGGNISYVNVTNLVVQDPVIELGGGPNGAPLTTNDGKDRGTLLHYYTTQPIDAFMGWDNGNGEFAFGSNVTNNLDVMTFNTLGNVRAQTFIGNLTGIASSATVANSANAVAGANVSGAVSFATTANSVAVANVSGIGNIATTNFDGNASNVLYGNGNFYALPTVSNVANANYANFAGTVITNAQPNITSVGTLTSLNITGNVSANAYQLTTSPGTLTAATGQMVWSASEQTMNLGMNYGVTQQVGLETYILIKASATISDGQVIMFTGANGDNVTGAPANTASVGFRPEYIIGVATQNIANNGFGYVTVFGSVHGLNTNAYNVGDILWVDNATPGALTATRPTDPNYQIEVAAVTKKSGGDGHIQVRVTTFNDINSLTDVTITTPANGQALVYSGNVWVNGVPAYANIANSVAGANVSGEVANAAYATTAGTAYSVDVANVVGIGNIATINLDGNVNNLLAGDGTFVPIPTDLANANYANFAGDVVNSSQPNITSVGTLTEVNTSGNINFIGGSNSEISQDYSNGATTMTIRGGNGSSLLILDGLANARLDANANVSINANSQGNIQAWTFDDTGNLTLPGNVFGINYANGTQVPIDNVANANYANFAGQVVDATQSNITAVGNLPYLQVSNSANADGVIQQFGSNNINITTTFSNVGTYKLTTLYHPNANTAYPADRIIRSRGNVTNPTTAVTSDRIYQKQGHVYNGNTNVLSVSETWTLAAGGTLDSNANQAYAGGQIIWATGNPAGGNLANVNALATQNQLIFTNSGSLLINPGTAPNTSAGQATSALLMTNYGLDSTNLAGVGGINQQKSRGNRDGLLSVQPNDLVGRMNFFGHNGTIYQTARPASLIAQVDSSYVANATVIPLNVTIRTVNSSNASVDTTFYGNGLTSLPGNLNVTGVSNLGANSNVIITGGTGGQVLSTDGAGNLSWITSSGGGGTPGGSNTQIQYNDSGVFGGNSNFTINTATGVLAATNFSGNGASLTSITGANVTGQVGNALVSGTVYTNAQPNITSVGTLSSLTVSGNLVPTNIVLDAFNETVLANANTSTSISPDVSLGTIFRYTANNNFTFNGLTNAVAGTSATVIITQDATGSRLLTSTMKYAGASKTLSTAAASIDIIGVFYDGTTYYASLTKGYA